MAILYNVWFSIAVCNSFLNVDCELHAYIVVSIYSCYIGTEPIPDDSALTIKALVLLDRYCLARTRWQLGHRSLVDKKRMCLGRVSDFMSWDEACREEGETYTLYHVV